MSGNYDDILYLPHHRSPKRHHMSMSDRAAQFSPFAALTGFEAAIGETGRLTDSRTELEDYGKDQLDQALMQLQALLPFQPEVTVTYFSPDERKSGGRYITIHGQVRKLDPYRQQLILLDGREISLPDVIRLECGNWADPG